MPNRKLRSLFGVVVFLVVTAQYAAASPPEKKPAEAAAPTTPKAKVGEACKTNADCDESSGPLSCLKAKCVVDHSRTPPPT